MALDGTGAVLIWNDITPEGRAEFYAWHLAEHMPERVAVPGFTRGRRFIACDAATSPEFFTLYETETPDVTMSQPYLSRLNDPTPWTRSATKGFRNTARALVRVLASTGPGPGGVLATVRFAVTPGAEAEVAAALAADAVPAAARLPEVTGVHLCRTDTAASEVKTAESRNRPDILTAPEWTLMIEGCNPAPVAGAVAALLDGRAAAGIESPVVGLYRLEHVALRRTRA